MSTTSTSTSTTSTTLSGAWTRTIGFYKTHPAITLDILTSSGGVTVCGEVITDVDVDHGHSALEALCISPMGDLRLQLVRQLTAAALTMAAGGDTFGDFATCNAACATPGAPGTTLSSCIADTDFFNNAGDPLPAPFDPPGAADPKPCEVAHDSACTVLDPGSCGAP